LKTMVYFCTSEESASYKIFPKVKFCDVEVLGHGIFRVVKYPRVMGKLALYVYLKQALPLIKGAFVFNNVGLGIGEEVRRCSGDDICTENLEDILSTVHRGVKNTDTMVAIENVDQLNYMDKLLDSSDKLVVLAGEDISEKADETMLERFGIAGGVKNIDTASAAGKTLVLLPGAKAPKMSGAKYIINLSGRDVRIRGATPKSIYVQPPTPLREVCKYTGNDASTVETLMDFYGIKDNLIRVYSVKIDK